MKQKIILYHTNWATYDRNFQVKDLPIHYITDINYAFLDLKLIDGFYRPVLSDPWADTDKPFPDGVQGHVDFNGNLGEFMKLKNLGIPFKFGISVGGWTFSKHFSDAVHSQECRQAFVQGLIDLVKRFPKLIDRIDLDWEHISPPGQNHGDPGNTTRPDDGHNFALFLQLLRHCLDQHGFSAVALSMCISAVPGNMTALPFKEMVQYLETINIMTYDFATSAWGPCNASHQTNLFPSSVTQLSVHQAVEAVLNYGVPPFKIVIGAAFYSRGFANTNGLGHPSQGVVADKSWEDGVVDYKHLPRPGAVEYWDDQAKATFSYDPQRKILNSYDSVDSIRAKSRYCKERGLGGIIVWESSGDLPVQHPRSLIRAMHESMNSS
ncbi:glycoside hydrolase [Gorgonomyces haynaldii]|nr:glycoside hydrolase [Gorgonomyces haynaldii]